MKPNLRSHRVAIACCGLFHYGRIAPGLESKVGHLQMIYSHRLPSRRYVANQKNLFWKEYIVRGLTRILSDRNQSRLFPWVHELWDIVAARSLEPCDMLHVMLHGNARRVIRRAREFGAVILGEPVNSHPDNYHRILLSQANACGVSYDPNLSVQLRRLKHEVSICDYLTVPSDYVRASFEGAGVSASRIFVNPFGASLDDFTLSGDQSARHGINLNCICVAQVIPRKGLHLLVEAWKSAGFDKRSDCSLRIVGRVSKEMAYLVRAAPHNVKFLGPMLKADVIHELHRASVFVLPTLEEGFAYAILEALAAGCVVVTTTPSGAASVINHGISGFLLDPEKPAELVSTLEYLRGHPELRFKIADRGRAAVRSGFTWADYVSRACDSYQSVIGRLTH